MDLPATKFVIKDLLPQGLAIIGGAPKVGKSYEKTKSIIEGGILTENYTDVQSNDEDDAGTTDFLLPDSSLNPENIYFKQELYDKLYEAYLPCDMRSFLRSIRLLITVRRSSNVR